MKTAMLLVFAAALVYVTYAYVEVTCPTEPDPDKDYALVPHPCNCSSYFVCYAGVKTAMPCYPDLEWNKEKKQCDWPYIAKCKTDPRCKEL